MQATAYQNIASSAPVIQPHLFLDIVRALGLDNIQVKAPATAKRATKKASSLTPYQTSNSTDILESGRNNKLTSLAGSMRRTGMTHEAIEAALHAENRVRCLPPLDPQEVSSIAQSIMRYPAEEGEEILKSLNDVGNANRFGNRYKERIKYVRGLGWLIWNDRCWERDAVGSITELAKEVASDIYNEGQLVSSADVRLKIAQHAKASHQAPRLKSMLQLAESLPSLVAQASQLDTHDMLLGVSNGVVNLQTGKLTPAKPEYLMTRHSQVTFDNKAKCPNFRKFITHITGGDQELENYLQRVVGYSLSGVTTEQCLFFLYGSGANGKSTFLNVVKELLGPELAKQTPSETLMTKRSSGTNDLARLQNIRVVSANEVEDSSLLAESLVKQMTGGEALTARFHYQEFFEFIPKFKLFIAGNHKPVIRGRDDGIWRRIRLIPFEVTIPKNQRDPHLQDKLRAELPGILNWALHGFQAWQQKGLTEPKLVTEAVASYREEMDIIGAWLGERCTLGAGEKTKGSDAYRYYKLWAEESGYKPMSSGAFGREFAARFPKIKRNDGNYYQGVKCA